MAGISSKSAGGLENRKKFNGIENENDLDINIYEAFYRDLDPQIGRWWQIDPKIDRMEMWSPFVLNFDNPIRLTDPLGDIPGDPLDEMNVRGANSTERNKNRFHRIDRRNPDGSTRKHHGIDLLAKKGTPLKSIGDGIVVQVVNSFKPGQYAKNSFGNTVTIKMNVDGKAVYIKYAHLDNISVKEGGDIKAGDLLGKTGNTGNAVKIPQAENHVHIEASYSGIPNKGVDRVDPELFFSTKFDGGGNPIKSNNGLPPLKNSNSENAKTHAIQKRNDDE